MIKALDPYLRRKVIKEPRPTSLGASVARTWEGFRTADPPASFMPQESQPAAMQAMDPPRQPQQMELDASFGAVLQMPAMRLRAFFALSTYFVSHMCLGLV